MAWIRLPLLITLLALGNYVQGQRQSTFSLTPGDRSLESALSELNLAGGEVSYRPDLLHHLTVRVPRGRKPLERWLQLLLMDSGFIYRRGEAGYLILPDPDLQGRTYRLFGVVTDDRSGERLIGATVQVIGRAEGTQANDYGFYSLPVPAGRVALRITYIGYAPLEAAITVRSDSLVDLQLSARLNLPQVIVTATTNLEDPARFLETGLRIGRTEVSQLGGPGGEDDPLQLARLLPGVTSGADGIGGALIRGSEAGHNLILLDGVPVYGLTHAGGLFSVFSNQAIRRIDLYKEGLPARFGGRIGGVLDVHTRDGNLYNAEHTIGSSLLASQLTAEGPIVRGESSYLLTGRYFWAGPVLGQISQTYKENRGRQGRTDYDVYDFNLKLNQKTGKDGRVYLSVYRGLDNYANTGEQASMYTDTSAAGTPFTYYPTSSRSESVRWVNTVGALRYNHIFNDRMFGNFRLSYSRLNSSLSFERYDSLREVTTERITGKIFSGNYASDIRQIGGAFDGQYALPDLGQVIFGAELNFHRFSPQLATGAQSLYSLQQDAENVGQEVPVHRPVQLAVYGSLSSSYRSLRYRVGLRASSWRNGPRTYYSFSPRLLLAGPLDERADWQVTYDRTVQPVQLLNSFVIGLPSDLWVPSTSNIGPATAPQVAGKVSWRWKPGWNLSSSVYYRKLNGLVAYAETSANSADWLDNLSRGSGRAYGWETMVQRTQGRLRGWVGYTLAKSDRTFDARINQGRRFPFRYDRRHALSLIAIYQLGKRTTLTGSWRYQTGLAYSLSKEIIPVLDGDENNSVPFTQERNGFRMVANHRLDLNLHTELSGPGARTVHSIDVGVYNVYNRHNPVYYDPRLTYELGDDATLDGSLQAYQIFVAPLLPALSYHLTFSGRDR